MDYDESIPFSPCLWSFWMEALPSRYRTPLVGRTSVGIRWDLTRIVSSAAGFPAKPMVSAEPRRSGDGGVTID
jgi:hypothetical protein